jgi:hypothetical protein
MGRRLMKSLFDAPDAPAAARIMTE